MYRCYKCSQSFNTNSQLRSHITAMHADEPISTNDDDTGIGIAVGIATAIDISDAFNSTPDTSSPFDGGGDFGGGGAGGDW